MKAMIFSMVMAAALLTGCTTKGPDTTKVAGMFYGQQRTYESLRLVGANEINIRGSNVALVVSNELQPLSMLPKDPGIVEPLVRGLVSVAGIYTAGEVMKDLAAAPQVIETKPEIVRPEIVTVPAASP